MKHVLILLIILVISCKNQTQSSEETEKSASEVVSTTLTPEQLEEGWQLLFDGKTLNGWRTFKNQPNDSWRVENGTLHCLPFDSANQRADLITVDQYKDFELQFDWKIGFQGNSGVMFRVTEEFDQPYLTGPEYQLMDDKGYPGESPEKNKTGSNFDMQEAKYKKLNPTGEWNTSKLLVNGNMVEHWLNGVKVLSYELGSDAWKEMKANCKWKDADAYGMAEKGFIDLQDHSSEVWFRNIMIRVL